MGGSVKCKEVEWSVAGWSLNERPWSVDNCSEVKWSVVGWSVVKCSESLSNRVSNVTGRYIDRMKFAAYMTVFCIYDCFVYHILSYSFGSIFYHSIYGCRFCIRLLNFVIYIYLLLRLCILIVMYVLCIVCVWMYTVLLPPGVNPIAVNIYIISYIVYHIIYWSKK